MEIVILPPHDFLHNNHHHRRRNPRNPNHNRLTRRAQPSPGPVVARPGPTVDGFYAGTSCATSPPPSELPLPAFFTRSDVIADVDVVDDDDNKRKIASDLRRVLKLC
ncbi:hypothetical protein vseg_006734 [Gypsophila vaccaria]